MQQQEIDKEQRQKILLALIYLFILRAKEKDSKKGEEMRRATLVECIKTLQQKYLLGYKFGEKSLDYCSIELLDDLRSLRFHPARIKQYHRDLAGWPTNLISLPILGKWQAKKTLESLDQGIIAELNEAVENTLRACDPYLP